MPAHLDWFGWCTWDAFYQDVTPDGIREGLERYQVNLEKFVVLWLLQSAFATELISAIYIREFLQH